MRFRVIQGGRTDGATNGAGDRSGPVLSSVTTKTEDSVIRSGPSVADVRTEAKRRRLLCGLETARNREAATGRAMPVEMRRLALMFDFVESKLASLVPVPEDFTSDIYWPRPETAAI